jgi:hypothetical protein
MRRRLSDLQSAGYQEDIAIISKYDTLITSIERI